MDLQVILIQLLLAAVGSLGFALIFNVPGKTFLFIGAGGIICWGIYLAMFEWFHSGIFFASLISTMAATLYSSWIARKIKIPTVAILMPSYITLIPGKGLYETMRYAVVKEWGMVGEYGLQTLEYALGIAFGMSIILVFLDYKKKQL